MKVYVNNYEIREVTAYIDPIPIVHDDGIFYHREIEVNMKQVKDVISSIELLGYKIKEIKLMSGTNCDLDNKYYKRFPDEILDNWWRRLHYSDCEVFIKRNRFYTVINGYTIVLPKNMYTSYDTNQLWLKFIIERK